MTWWIWMAFGVHVALLAVFAANMAYLRRCRPRRTEPPSGRLSVLIPARNEAPRLERLLPALAAQHHPDLEVLVIDDGSSDETADLLQAVEDPRIRSIRLEGPPDGWLGKNHALHVGAAAASGDRFLFLDADVTPMGLDALARIDALHGQFGPGTPLTGWPRIRGGGLLLVSQVPFAAFSLLPWPLVRPTNSPSLAALNGQCWLIDRDTYRREPLHERFRAEILEDVCIGRHLKRCGHPPAMVDLKDTLEVHMYDDLAGAWLGFRKNAYLIMGGTPVSFGALWIVLTFAFVVAPVAYPLLFLSLYVVKSCSDRCARLPLYVSLAAPLSYLLAAILQIDSFLHHLTGKVSWKGRRVVD